MVFVRSFCLLFFWWVVIFDCYLAVIDSFKRDLLDPFGPTKLGKMIQFDNLRKYVLLIGGSSNPPSRLGNEEHGRWMGFVYSDQRLCKL